TLKRMQKLCNRERYALWRNILSRTYNRLFKSRYNRSRTLFSFALPLCFSMTLCFSISSFFLMALKNKGVLLYGLLCFMLFNLSTAQAQSPENGEAAEGQTEIKPLQIGDTIPEALWSLPLQVINHPEGKDTITLNDYRDKKLIILDFWATWCGSCLSSIRTMYHLSDNNPDVGMLPVAKQTAEEIAKAQSIKYWFKDMKQVSAVNADFLSHIFNSVSLPHLVWVSDGQVRAITNGLALTQDNIDVAVSGKWFKIPFKEFENQKRSKI